MATATGIPRDSRVSLIVSPSPAQGWSWGRLTLRAPVFVWWRTGMFSRWPFLFSSSSFLPLEPLFSPSHMGSRSAQALLQEACARPQCTQAGQFCSLGRPLPTPACCHPPPHPTGLGPGYQLLSKPSRQPPCCS